MKKLIVALLALTAILIAAPAQARHADTRWRYVETVNGFYISGQPFDLEELMTSDRQIKVYQRWTAGVRLIRANADNVDEYQHLRSFARRHPKKQYPTVFCMTGAYRGYLLDLAFFYDEREKKLSRIAKAHYKAWVKNYTKRTPGCTAFVKR